MNYQIQATVVVSGRKYTSVRQIPTFTIPNCASNGDATAVGLAIITSAGCDSVIQVSMTVMRDDGCIWSHEFGKNELRPIQRQLKVA